MYCSGLIFSLLPSKDDKRVRSAVFGASLTLVVVPTLPSNVPVELGASRVLEAPAVTKMCSSEVRKL